MNPCFFFFKMQGHNWKKKVVKNWIFIFFTLVGKKRYNWDLLGKKFNWLSE
jgi:hypothetical protein